MMFEIGDRVRSIVDKPSGNECLEVDSTGTIVYILGGNILHVRWDLDEPNPSYFHTCDGKCERGYGWNVWVDEVQLIDDLPDIEISVDELCDFLEVSV